MEFEIVAQPQVEEDSDEWNYPYKKDRPLDRAFLVIFKGKALYLDHIGPGISYYLSECPFHEDDYSEPDGVYVWEGKLVSREIVYLEGDRDVEVELVGTMRPATIVEWNAHINDEYIWDRSDWLLPEKVVEG